MRTDRLDLRRLLRPIDRFLKIEASSGVLLLVCALLGLGWANSPWAASYHALWEGRLSGGSGSSKICGL